MSTTSETAAVILDIRMRRIASNLWQALLVDDAELAAVAATPGGARAELKALVSIALGVPAPTLLFSAASGIEAAEAGEWGYEPEPFVHLFA